MFQMNSIGRTGSLCLSCLYIFALINNLGKKLPDPYDPFLTSEYVRELNIMLQTMCYNVTQNTAYKSSVLPVFLPFLRKIIRFWVFRRGPFLE